MYQSKSAKRRVRSCDETVWLKQSFKGALNYRNFVVIFIDGILIKEMGRISLLWGEGGALDSHPPYYF